MTARSAFLILAATLAGAGAVVAASAEAPFTWGYSPASGRQDDASLAYGLEGSDAVAAILRCKPGSGRVAISTFPAAARQGAVVTLRSGAAVSRRRSHAEPNEAAEGMLVQTLVPARDPVLQAFRRGGRLSIATGSERTDLPAASRALTDRFFRSCGG
jgi:hypothetical protein